jgi:GTPase SAR1 family protein
MIKVHKNPVIKLDIPHFLCDTDAVGKHLNDHPLTSLLNVYGFLCVIGRPGSGKTSFSIALMTQSKPKVYKKTHHHMIILMPANSISSLKKNPFKVLPPENIYHELTDQTINEIYNKIDGYSAKDEKTLLFIDDMTADLKKSKFIMETLKKIIYNRRHLKTNLIITAQSFTNIPLDVRKNIQNLILFRPSKKEMELVFEELFETKKDIFQSIMKIAYDEKHNFLFLNVPTQRLFKNFDELIINDDYAGLPAP